jgi:methionyl-tRNA formyltransferase
MKVVFFGTPYYVIPVLSALNKYHKLLMVVTQSPKPSGRDKKITYSDVDTWAHERHIPKTFDLNDVPEADLGIVASYGKIIPKSVIEKFKYGILNIHPSLLPKYRGASPVQSAIASGETTTGLTIILMDEKMDHGPIISYFKEDIRQDDTTKTLRDRLFERSVEFLIDLIPSFISEKIRPKAQNEAEASFTKTINKDDGYVDMTKGDNLQKERFIRAMSPWPGAWTYVQIGGTKKRLKIISAHLEDEKLVLDEVQLEGKTPVSWNQFKLGYPKFIFLES